MVAEKFPRDAHCSKVPGRPRDPEVEARILDVTLRLMAERGYSRMSLDEIAAEAGASKPTVYRRWPTKAHVAMAALRTLQIREEHVNTGDAQKDLVGILQNFRRSLLRPNGVSLIGTVLVEEHHNPELLALFRERVVGPRRAMLKTVLNTARERGELREEVNPEWAADMLVGAFYARYLATSKIPAEYPAELVKIIWTGLRRS